MMPLPDWSIWWGGYVSNHVYGTYPTIYTRYMTFLKYLGRGDICQSSRLIVFSLELVLFCLASALRKQVGSVDQLHGLNKLRAQWKMLRGFFRSWQKQITQCQQNSFVKPKNPQPTQRRTWRGSTMSCGGSVLLENPAGR